MVPKLICLCVGYLCGCPLTGELVARSMTGKSAFEIGDGNPGMANVGHELGTTAAALCLAGDILKTLLPVLLMSRLFPQLGWHVATAWTGLGATLGHIWPFWHGFRGGKGVTTIFSTIILMQPLFGILAGIVSIVTIVLSGYLSVGAVVGMLFYTIATALKLPRDCAFVSLVFTVLQLITHGSKLRGILNGTTRRASISTKFWSAVRKR